MVRIYLYVEPPEEGKGLSIWRLDVDPNALVSAGFSRSLLYIAV